MPAIPPSDEPSLPKLRRFRFDAQDPKVAREVDVDGETPDPTSGDAEARDLASVDDADPGTPRADTAPAVKTPADDDLHASDRMLAALDGSAASVPSADSPAAPVTGPTSGSVAAPTSGPATGPTSGSVAGATSASASGPTSARSTDAASRSATSSPHDPARSGVGAGSQPRSPAQADGPSRESRSGSAGLAPRTAPTTLPAPLAKPDGAKARSGWIFAVAGIIIALIIGLIAWLVLGPDDEPAESGEPARAADSAVSDWAEGICGELDAFQTASLPLRAEVAKANASDSDDADVSDVQRQSSELLSSLAADLQTVDIPSDSKEASTAHTTIISAVNAAATSVKASGSSAVGTPEDASAAILDALDRPVAVFQQTLDDLPASDRAQVSSTTSCGSLT